MTTAPSDLIVSARLGRYGVAGDHRPVQVQRFEQAGQGGNLWLDLSVIPP